ncbi:hypothetical protein SUGI_0857150 [Cryptomeria japonica]|nr:hypothetical protein SUGI_0857150 [Cryptomeria japonica]
MTPVGIRGSFNLKQTILFAKSFLRRLHKYRVSFAQHSLTNFTCLLLKSIFCTGQSSSFDMLAAQDILCSDNAFLEKLSSGPEFEPYRRD